MTSRRERSVHYYNLFYSPAFVAKAEEALQKLEPERMRGPRSLSPIGILSISHQDVYFELVRDRINGIKAEHGLPLLVVSPAPRIRFGQDPSPVIDIETGTDYPSKHEAGNVVGPTYSIPAGRWAWTKLDQMFPYRFREIPYKLYYEEA